MWAKVHYQRCYHVYAVQRLYGRDKMIYSTPVAYALRGLALLAERAGPRVLMLEQITAGTALPREFLAKLFHQLVKSGILKSSKGRGGGFALGRACHEITLMQIVEAIDGPGVCDACVLGLDGCSDARPCPQHDLFKPIRHRIRDYLTTTTLADLVSSIRAAPHITAPPNPTSSQGS